MGLSRRAFLFTQGSALGAAALFPGHLLAAVEAATPAVPRLDEWSQVKKQFALSPEWLHFAGFFIASHPAPVRDAIEGYRRAIDDNPFLVVEQGLFESEAQNLQSRVRMEAAAYLGGKPEEVALTQNTTTGLGLVYLGLPLKAGQEVLTTEHDHIVHHESIRLATERVGASFRKIPLFDEASTATVDGIVGRIRAALRPTTRAVGVTWVHSQTGIRLPIRQISAALSEVNRARDPADRVLLVVDGVHGLGCVDETVAEMGADFFCAGTHKWIFAPRGTGLIWARPEAWAQLRQVLPTFTDRENFVAWTENRLPHTPNNARRMTPGGFQAFEHQWAMAAAFRMHQAMGRARVAGRVRELNSRIKDGLAGIAKVKLHTPRDPNLSAGICCFEVKGQTPQEVVKALLSRKIIASTSPYAVRYARLSASIFNTPEEVDRAVSAVKTAVA
jgi:selenocysteine lyase/cysteine desulfurase